MLLGCRRVVPQAWDQRRDILQVAVALWRDGDLRRPQAEGLGRGESQEGSAVSARRTLESNHCIDRQRINQPLTKTADPKLFNKNDESTTMAAIAKATRQPFRMRGRSYVALTFCPLGR